MAVLLVSPHFDDAALSAHAVFADGALGEPVTVLTIFSGAPVPATSTDWDRRAGFVDSDQAMAARAIEDAKAFDGAPVTRLLGGLLESQYRNERQLDADRDALLSLISRWWEASRGVIVLPVGAGGPRSLLHKIRLRIPSPRFGLASGSIPNVDHLWVTDTIVRAFHQRMELAFYDDQPYAWTGDGKCRASELSTMMAKPLGRRVLHVDRQAKAERVKCYRSQVALLYEPWVSDVASVTRRTETLWVDTSTARSSRSG